jgi:hypothetical protein
MAAGAGSSRIDTPLGAVLVGTKIDLRRLLAFAAFDRPEVFPVEDGRADLHVIL